MNETTETNANEHNVDEMKPRGKTAAAAGSGQDGRVADRVSIFLRGRHWWMRYSLNGGQVREPLRVRARKDAVALAKRKNAQLLLGLAPPRQARGALIADAVEKFVQAKRHEGAAVDTLRMYRHELGQFAAFAAARGVLRLDQLRPTDLQEFQEALRTGGFTDYEGTAKQVRRRRKKGAAAASTLNRKVMLAKMLTAYAAKFGLAAQDPLAPVKLPPKGHPERHCFSPDEIRRVLEALPEHLKVVFRFLLQTGLRVGELCWLTKDDVDLTRRVIYIRRKAGWRPKRGRHREVPMLSADVVSIVEERLASSAGPWLFAPPASPRRRLAPAGAGWRRLAPGVSPKYSPKGVWEALRSVLRKLGVAGSTHCTRHTFATQMARAGVKVLDLKQILGHEKVETTMAYYHAGDLGGRGDLRDLPFDNLPPAARPPGEAQQPQPRQSAAGGGRRAADLAHRQHNPGDPPPDA